MGGVIDSGGGIGVRSSPRRAAIEKAQADLRQEHDVREERRRQLEFLEKGGNPLDFMFGDTTSHSIQSTSLTDKQADHFVKSEVKDSFPPTASPHGDSFESSGRPGVSEPNTADNLLLFAGNKSLEGERISEYPNKRNRPSESERSCKPNNFQNSKDTEDSAIFRPYARRNRSKINRDPARSSSAELVQKRDGLASSLSIRKGSLDVKLSIPDIGNNKSRDIFSVSCPSSATSNGKVVSESVVPSNLLNTEDDGLVVRESSATAQNTIVKEKVDTTFRKNSADLASRETGLVTASQDTNATQLNGLRDIRGEKESSTNSAAVGEKGLDRESSHLDNAEVDVDTKIDVHRVDKSDSNRISFRSASTVKGVMSPTVCEMANTQSENEAGDLTIIMSEQNSGHQSRTKPPKLENQGHRSAIDMQNENKCSIETERRQQGDLDMLQTDMRVTSGLADMCNSSLSPRKPQAAAETRTCITNKNILSGPGVTALKHQDSLDAGSRMVATLKEDSILEEARIIKAKRKRIYEISCGTVPVEVRTRSQWDFVLEEMAWLANDFAQERLWKMTAALQICHRVAFTSQLKFEKQIQQRKIKSIASTIANAVLHFWSSVEVPSELEETSLGTDKETWNERKCESGKKCSASGVMVYARRFLKFVTSPNHIQIAAPLTPDNMCDPGILETSWDDQLTEESLFYSVPSCATEAYRRSIESHLVWCEKSGSSMQEEVETSAYDTLEDTGYNGYEEDEETSDYYLPRALEFSKSFNITHQKKKKSMKYHSARSYDHGADLPYGGYTGGSNTLMGKRPASNVNVGSVPMKRMRTASRQRIASPFGCDTIGSLLVPSKTDASSGDTSSFQDEQISLNGGSAVQKGIEVESHGNFEKQLPYDMAETSGKPKKKKVSAYDDAWHPDSMVHGEQDHWKKRPENHINKNGPYGSHGLKKQKTTKQSVENNFDSSTPFTGSVPSPAASQMSNMSNPSKFIKFIGGRDRGRKIKGLKISSGQQGSDNPWLLFEDQALVVLVHDMGPNWELISDAMNSTLKIKCIYRNPSECKERHKILMDKTGGDGADSAEDSGNSQSYPSTLPGIPKGSARQLFQRLQGPVEEETLKSHFEKICLIGKKFHGKIQNDGRDPKQIVPVHNSQVMALSHVFPNNLNGSVLTPLDLCDASTSGQDVFPFENSGAHPGLPMMNQGTLVLPPSEAEPSIAGSSGVVLGNTLGTTSGPTSALTRFSSPRGSFPLNEQHRVQQYNQMLPGRNMQQSSLSTPGAVSGSDHGHSLVPGGTAMSVNGSTMSTPVSKPGVQGLSSLAVHNTGSMPSSGVRGRPNSVNINSVGSASQGKSTMRSREAMQHMMRAAKGISQGIPALSSGFTNQATPSVTAYPGHLPHQQQLSQQSPVLGNSDNPLLQSPNHTAGTQQQAFAVRQRQMHQRYLQQQKQQQQTKFLASGAMTPLVQSQPQIPPVSSSPQNDPKKKPLASSQPSTMPLSSTSLNMPIVQKNPPKPQLVVHGLGRKSQCGVSGPNNQAGKQRQQQLQQQFGREPSHQKQPVQGQQQNKLLKGLGRGNIMHQSNSVDPSHLNGTTISPETQGTKNIEPTVQAVPGQPSDPLTAGSTHPQSRPLIPQQSSSAQRQPKLFPGAQSRSSQQHQQRQLNRDNDFQVEVSGVVPGNNLSTSSPSVTPTVAQRNHQHLLLHEQLGNQVQTISRRIAPQNHDSLRKSETECTPHDPQSVINTTQTASIGSTESGPQVITGLVSTNTVGCTAVSSSPKELDLPQCDSSEKNAVSRVNSSIKNPMGSNSTIAQGLGLSPDGLTGHGRKDGTQTQQQQLQQSLPLVQNQLQLPEQLLGQNQKHIPSEQHQPYLKTLDLKAVQENSSSRPSDTKVE